MVYRPDERGQGLAEYGIIILLAVIVIMTVLLAFGEEIDNMLRQVHIVR